MEMAGALQLIKDKNLEIVRFAGTSAGGIIASMYAIGREPEEIWDELFTLDMSQFMTISIPSITRLFFWGSLNSGKRYSEYLRKAASNKKMKDTRLHLCLMGSNISKRRLDVMDKVGCPEMPVADAMRITSSLPGVFEPWRYEGDYYFDGSLYKHFPIDIWKDWPRSRFGYLMRHHSGAKPHWAVKTLSTTFELAVDGNVLESIEDVSEHMHSGLLRIAESDGLGFSTFDFTFTPLERERLYIHGYETMKKALAADSSV